MSHASTRERERNLGPEEQLDYEQQAEMLRALAHPARLRLLSLLASKPACVGELVEQTGYRQPYVSQNLAVLREVGLVSGTRDGATICYALVCPQMRQLLVDIRLTCRKHSELAGT